MESVVTHSDLKKCTYVRRFSKLVQQLTGSRLVLGILDKCPSHLQQERHYSTGFPCGNDTGSIYQMSL